MRPRRGLPTSARAFLAAWLIGLAVLPVLIRLDARIFSSAHHALWPSAITLLGLLTWLGYGAIDVGLFLALAAFAWWRADKTRTMPAVYGAIVVAASGLLDQVVKNLACRARPGSAGAGAFLAQFPCFAQGYALASFPSGHATTAFSAAVLLSLWYPRAAGPALGLAFVVALSRVVLGAHYPSDVLAGSLLGGGAAIAAYWLFPSLRGAGAVEEGEAA